MLGAIFNWKVAVLITVVLGVIFAYRGFCRFYMSVGSYIFIFNKISILGIKVDNEKCTNCGKCVAVCKMDIKKPGDFGVYIVRRVQIDKCGEGAICWEKIKREK